MYLNKARNEGLWTVLAYHGIKLKHIDAPVTAELIDYLQTYSGVEYLRLWSEFGNVGLNNDGGLASRFHRVLQLHSTSPQGAEHLACVSMIVYTHVRDGKQYLST